MLIHFKKETLVTEHRKTSRLLLAAFVVIIFLIGGLVFSIMMNIFEPRGRVNCSNFTTYEDANRAYSAGAYWLDGNNDGIPCELLYKKDHPPTYAE